MEEARFKQRVKTRLNRIYGECQANTLLTKLCQLVERYRQSTESVTLKRWDETDAILITYGDSLLSEESTPLQTLSGFLNKYCQKAFSTVHILPFFPYSSDDGFAVIDYRQVNFELGCWHDIIEINQNFDLVVDLVINHVSRESLWFMDFVVGQGYGKDFFHELEPASDVSQVVRPRNSPLLVPIHTRRGVKYVWATFSNDQIDLNFANPDVLLEFVDILLFYTTIGARFIRLDAIAFLWKKRSTPCIHLPETHEIVKLFRDVLEYLALGVVLITETNVPVDENISYFGEGDEAQMVYQFALPPLVLHALYYGKADYLTTWAQQIPPLLPNCTYLNFVASHDGIGLRAVEKIIPEIEVMHMIETVHRYGGYVSLKSNVDGSDSPYELNVSLFDALMGTRRGPDQWQVQRFLCSQIILLSVQGIPAIYIHSLTATPNDLDNVERTGRMRSINRARWNLLALENQITHQHSAQGEVFKAIIRLLLTRRKYKAFHPDAPQQVMSVHKNIFAIRRTSLCGENDIIVFCNVSQVPVTLALASFPKQKQPTIDLISGKSWQAGESGYRLQPYQCCWLLVKDTK
ncbi:sugar phosphorylase [Spartinivicinus ruber]|uniref:sugar phosphorylase n=1 Tax=Spartinivicinus ruber TaxID=2683272 RepID=UPI0013D23DE7|nr:sugar phosphorylase [Spartinivicinus ruber]